MCQPTGATPVAERIVAWLRAMTARSSASAMPAWETQRQPWQETSWPAATAACSSQGVRSAARPQVENVAGIAWAASASSTRRKPARGP